LFLKHSSKNNISTILISNKNSKNSLSRDFFVLLSDVLDEIIKNKDIKLLILRGDGDNFSSGINLNELIKFPSTVDAREFSILMDTTINKLFSLKIPTISIVDGYCLGLGAALVLSSDISIFTENVKFGFPAVKLGAAMPASSIKRFISVVGANIAKKLLLTGELINSDEALNFNIASYVTKKEELDNLINKVINQLLEASPLALEITKNTINNYVNTESNLYSEDSFAFLYSNLDWHKRIWTFLNKDK